MNNKIELLDCTLRDGAYIVDSKFGTSSIKGIIDKLQKANVDIIECGWLKDKKHEFGTPFYHVPSDLEQYLISPKKEGVLYTAMIDYNRYDLNNLPDYDGKSIDAIRVVFPREAFKTGIALGEIIKSKGYKVMFQAANTYGYSDYELLEMVQEINKAKPSSLSVVDTFGAMYSSDLSHIISIIDKNLDQGIKLGFHSHNNRQLSFALSMQFVDMLCHGKRGIVVDSRLCGMGRGAGNTTTELIADYLNNKHDASYVMDDIMDAIDMYMGYYLEHFQWGYSIPYMLAGTYCVHVNNIAYLTKAHRSCAKDMKKVLELLEPEKRTVYDYDNLERVFVVYQSRKVDDEATLQEIGNLVNGKKILMIAPGKTSEIEQDKIKSYIEAEKHIVISVNAVMQLYPVDAIFFGNRVRYEYAKTTYANEFKTAKRYVLSNITQETGENESVINYDRLLKTGWKHFDNSAIMCLRLLDKFSPNSIAIAGMDGFNEDGNTYFQDNSFQTNLDRSEKHDINVDMQGMIDDYMETRHSTCPLKIITSTMFRFHLNSQS